MLRSGLMKLAVLIALACAPIFSQNTPPPSDDETPVFGISVYLSGLTGQIYKIRENSKKLPDFEKLKPIGTIYTYSLAVPPRDFKEGFPGLTDRLEWFAIDYTGRFFITTPGSYKFVLTSDDGSRLYIDGKKVIDNDGLHVPEAVTGSVKLKGGIHDIRVSYFQGPRFHVALTLEVAPPDGEQRIFNTQDFRPPSDDEVPPKK
jgi:hypothetical protein